MAAAVGLRGDYDAKALRWKVSNPLLVAAAAVVGLIAFPLLNPAWVMIK